ncbi:MAG: hypothetical protein PHV59_09955, partial [Victivallales bacterium]|nr:hypothetical protein [Victivallales bacterium]
MPAPQERFRASRDQRFAAGPRPGQALDDEKILRIFRDFKIHWGLPALFKAFEFNTVKILPKNLIILIFYCTDYSNKSYWTRPTKVDIQRFPSGSHAQCPPKICFAHFGGHRLARAVLIKAQQVARLLPLV